MTDLKTRRGFFKTISSLILGAALATPLDILVNKEKPKVSYKLVVPVLDYENIHLYDIELDPDENLRQVSNYLAFRGLRLKIDIV